ncbi:MAG: hypothetical protein ABIJ96_02265 [Elusimicrobiota bacterium]
MTRLLACSLLCLPLICAAADNPLDRELERLAAKKMRLVRKVTAPIEGGELAVLLLEKKGARPRTALRVYRLGAGQAKLLHLEPGFGKTVRLADIHAAEELPDLNGDGSRIAAYLTERKNINQTTLLVLRYANGRLERLADFSGGEFRDLNEDGRPEILERTLPLGKFFNINCEEVFHSLAQNAYRTRVYAWQDGAYQPASRKFPAFLQRRIKETRERLDGVDIRATDSYGDYLGDALSLFFLYEEKGDKRAGWKEFSRRFKVRKTDLPPVKRCYGKLRSELKEKLSIPEDW